MKKLLLSVAVVATSFVFGQVTLAHTYSSENLQVYTNATETYYYSAGYGISNVKIYKGDYTLHKQFTPSVPVGYTMFVDQYDDNFILSKNVFNTDSKLEIIVTFEKYNNVTSQREYIIRIYNEDGTILNEFGPNYKFSDEYDINIYHDNVTNTNKLRLFNQTTNSTEIYNLPTTSLAAKEIQSQGKLSAFPIPTNKILNIINPNNGANKVQVYDTSGKLVMNKSFSSNEDKIVVDVEDLTKGIYIYKIGELSSKFIKN